MVAEYMSTNAKKGQNKLEIDKQEEENKVVSNSYSPKSLFMACMGCSSAIILMSSNLHGTMKHQVTSTK